MLKIATRAAGVLLLSANSTVALASDYCARRISGVHVARSDSGQAAHELSQKSKCEYCGKCRYESRHFAEKDSSGRPSLRFQSRCVSK